MAKLTEEQKAERAATRRRDEALTAEAEYRRREAKQREWRQNGANLTREELEAGEACRGCSLPVMDRLGSWSWPKDRTPDQQVGYDQAEADYRARHADCHGHRWSISGSRSMHCGECCPPHPLHQSQIDQIAAIFHSHTPTLSELDTWRLTLTCEHTIDRTSHKSNQRWTCRVVECPTCGTYRGVVGSEKLEPR